jgi:hypothetical protein
MQENKPKSLFSCHTQKISFYPFLLPILYMIFRFCKDQMLNSTYPHNVKILKYNLPYLFYLYLPKIFAIIFFPIIRHQIKDDGNENNKMIKQYHINAIQNSKKHMFSIILIISLLEVIQENGDLLLYFYERLGKIHWLVEKKSGLILFVPLFAFYLLKAEIFRHHVLALILGFIGVFVANFCRFPLEFSRTEDYPYHLLNFFFSSLLSLAFVLIKYVMTKYVITSPYIFLFYNGLLNILVSFVYVLFEYILVANLPYSEEFEKDNDNFFINNYVRIFTLLVGQDTEFYIYFSLMFIVMFVYYIITALTIYNFNLYLIIVVETCLPIDNDMIEIFYKSQVYVNKEKVIKRVICQCFGYIIIIFSSLILNEIIVLNIFGFNNNIRANIASRGKIEIDVAFELEKCEEESETDDKENNNNINSIDSETNDK